MQRHLVLTGPMGSGKTTVGKLLAERLGRQFGDSDEMLEARFGQDARQLARRHGVRWLHKQEGITLREALAEPEPIVMAAAASTGDLDDLEDIIDRDRALVVVLTGEADQFFDRMDRGKHRRPIDPQVFEAITERRLSRLRRAGAQVVDVGDESPAGVADAVEAVVERSGGIVGTNYEDVAGPVVDDAMARGAEDER